jgi:hypothetical protein
MSEIACENCTKIIKESIKTCPSCGYPQHGTKAEKITYNGKVLRVKDLVEDSDKSIKGLVSFAIIFMVMALVVLLFSLMFKEYHYENVVLFTLAASIYYFLSRLGKRSSYLMVILALFIYVGHTIFEFSHGMFLKSPVGLNESFFKSRGATLFFAIIPLAYLIFRLSLMIVLAKYLWIQLKLKRDEKILSFIRGNEIDVKKKKPT